MMQVRLAESNGPVTGRQSVRSVEGLPFSASIHATNSDHPTRMILHESRATTLSRSIALFPEYHLTGCERGRGITQDEPMHRGSQLGDGVVIAGYVGRDEDDFFSSAIVLDGDGDPFSTQSGSLIFHWI